jgi:hypothetical protein
VVESKIVNDNVEISSCRLLTVSCWLSVLVIGWVCRRLSDDGWYGECWLLSVGCRCMLSGAGFRVSAVGFRVSAVGCRLSGWLETLRPTTVDIYIHPAQKK